MPITIDGDGTITGVSVGGLPDGIVDTDMIAAGAVTQAKRGAATGTISGVLQIVHASTSTQVTVSTRTFTDTGLTASITPSSASNKILVIVDQQFQINRVTAGIGAGIRVLRDSTTIHDPVADSTGPYEIYNATATGFYDRITITKLDSPSSTSSVTYKAQGRPYTDSNSGFTKFNNTDTVSGTSYITLIEVAA